MSFNTSALSINTADLIQAGISPEIQRTLFVSSIAVVSGLAVYLLMHYFPQIPLKIRDGFSRFMSNFGSEKREARLNKVVCYHCNEGKGIYNPKYLTINEEPHIEGACSACGNFIRVSLR